MTEAQCSSQAATAEPADASDSIEKAAERLRLVLPLLARYGLPADPIHYGILYHYVAGRGEALASELEPVVGGERTLTPELSRQLFARYVCECDLTVLDPIRQNLQQVLADTAHQMRESGGETARLRSSLANQAEALSGPVDAQTLPRLLGELIGTTVSLGKASETLESRLTSAAGQVNALSEELDRLRRESATDALTRVMNRRAFERALAQAIEQARGSPLCLVMVDIDHFKRVNDTFGHVVGDKVLRVIAELLGKGVKGRDTVARYGGEEFVLVLPDTPLEGARAVAEAVRRTIERSRLKRTDTGEPIGVVTVSLGVGRYRDGESAEEFVHRCDVALYQAKRSGRNRVALAP